MNDDRYQTSFTYVAGFLISIALTLTAYLLVDKHLKSHHFYLSDGFLIGAVSVLAITQLLAQLIFFLHMDREKKPLWSNTALLFAGLVVIIIVFGSLWIMANLNYHHGAVNVTHDGQHLTPQQTSQYIIHDEGIH